MLKDANLLIKFQDKAAKADIYLRNYIATKLVINNKQISLKEAFTRITLLINYIRV